tara:strand:- start:3065 stop:3217 length:153 start_codon:yes stop_codon:yes gene_type:complete
MPYRGAPKNGLKRENQQCFITIIYEKPAADLMPVPHCTPHSFGIAGSGLL